LIGLMRSLISPLILVVLRKLLNAISISPLKRMGLNRIGGGYIVFMNPPYGREISKWVRKAYEESLKGVVVVCLVPARTDTRWWWDYCMKGEIRFIKGGLKFRGRNKEGLIVNNSATFPSAVVIFNNGKREEVNNG